MFKYKLLKFLTAVSLQANKKYTAVSINTELFDKFKI